MRKNGIVVVVVVVVVDSQTLHHELFLFRRNSPQKVFSFYFFISLFGIQIKERNK